VLANHVDKQKGWEFCQEKSDLWRSLNDQWCTLRGSLDNRLEQEIP
jgi:hypothetical protein